MARPEFFVPDRYMTAQFYRVVIHNNHDALRALMERAAERGGFIGHADRDKVHLVVQNDKGIASWPKEAIWDNTEIWEDMWQRKQQLFNLNQTAWPWNAVFIPA